MPKMTIVGFEYYMNMKGDSLFKDMLLPTGINGEILKNTIMLKCADFGLLYTDPNFMQYQVGMFFRKNYKTFEDWLKGVNSTYNPIENYDRWEDWTDIGAKKSTDNIKDTTAGSDTSSGTSGNTQTYDVTTDNSGTYKPKDKTTDSGTSSNTSTSSLTRNADTNSVEDTSGVHSGHIHGNIGVTTAAQMLTEFYKISAWNIYDNIANMFAKDFCIGLYL